MAASPVLPSSPWPALRAHPLLGRLPAPVLSRLLAQMDAVSFAPGQCLTREGEPAEALYLITGGQAERLGEGLGEGIGEGTPQAVLGANDLAGQAAAGLAHHVHTVRALTEVQAWRIDRAAVAQLCAAVPRLEARLIHSLSAQAPAPPDPPAATPANARQARARLALGQVRFDSAGWLQRLEGLPPARAVLAVAPVHAVPAAQPGLDDLRALVLDPAYQLK